MPHTGLAQGRLRRFSLGEALEGEFVSACLVRDVQNSKDLLRILMEKSHPLLVNLTRCPSAQSVILMNAKMIYSLEHILVSVSTCLLRRKFQSKMKTRAFETEVIYNMSPSTNISASLRAFGLTDTTKDVVCLFVNIDDADAIGEFLGLVQGQVDVLDHISRVNEVSEIAKMLGIPKTCDLGTIRVDEMLRGQISIKDV